MEEKGFDFQVRIENFPKKSICPNIELGKIGTRKGLCPKLKKLRFMKLIAPSAPK
ncbi:hypothetical protein LEP1GSC161_0187 [Leptospira santarosai str. CBC1416]|uniref:Uncharacterized protein n=1 Tax=Leptospira santarosai str. CBC1416 TaxID=1193059 RepID=M6VU91_9LEPT|nr:hypothetical protein LEP1GSC076_0571 [Leptospira sp. Fiocruz LV4135]EMO56589.1 hypothetical protein LEP1GSC161_0187 [Leptospira santarosai str. CBC1416]EPG81700.1 hypothetical protein LEP1GSC048_2955 [Leptospira santarosai serovar Shermani str. 1342KT]